MSKKAAQERSRDLDQFYTEPAYANHFYNIVSQHLDLQSADILLEPSAGSGNFYNLLDAGKRVGLDLDPKAAGIVQQDFFTWAPTPGSKVVTVGNPPFGKNSSLAVKFFNHAAVFSDAIAFVLPRTFKKSSIINRLHEKFHLVYEEIVPDNSFIFNGKPYDVWCCAQIWVKRDQDRTPLQILNFKVVKDWFEIVSPSNADFSIQRVGGRAGTIRISSFDEYSDQSHYFIKQHDPRVLQIFQSINFDNVKHNTAGNPSISPSELIQLWIEHAVNNGITIQLPDTSKSKTIVDTLFETIT
jgi:predicted RNA methylase